MVYNTCALRVHFVCYFVKPGSRFPYRPEKWGQRVCYQKSCHKPSSECAASLGLQTFAGAVPFSFFFLFLVWFGLFVPSQDKNNNKKAHNTSVMTLSLFICGSSGLWAEHRVEDASNWLPGGGDAWPRAAYTGKKGSCQHYQVGFPLSLLDCSYSHVWHNCLWAPSGKKQAFCKWICQDKNLLYVVTTGTGDTIHQPRTRPKFSTFFTERQPQKYYLFLCETQTRLLNGCNITKQELSKTPVPIKYLCKILWSQTKKE